MKRSQKNPISLRAGIVGVLFTLWLLVIGGKVICLQVFQGDRLSKKASNQYETSVRAEGKRGVIYDRNGSQMAVSTDATSISANPGKIGDLSQASVVLAEALGTDRKTIAQKLSPKKSFVWVQRQVTPRQSAAVSALQLTGINFLSEVKRYYPNRTLAAQVLGFTGVDGNGLEGLEYRYNEALRGSAESRTVLKDALGRGFAGGLQTEVGSDGNNLILTLDNTVQYLAEQALKEAVDTYGAQSGMVLVMAPETGELLAMAHYPFFNPNVYSESEQWKWRNRAITDPFEPGSTLKVFTAAAAIEKGGCDPDSIFFCENGSYRVAGHTLHDTHENGWMSLGQIIKHSSNIGTAKITERIGEEPLYATLRDFGFGQRTGIDCPGETAGSLPSYRKWRGVDALTISFGQGMSVSALQLTAAINAIANDGVLMRPYVVQAVVDADGKDVKRFEPETVRRVVSAETARMVTEMMVSVTTEGGTGASAALEGYRVAGKTGTAQKVGESGRYEAGRYVSSFVGFVPADSPKATIVVIVDEPETEHYGGKVAGPAFRKIAGELMRYLDVDPSAVPAYSPGTDTKQLTVSRDRGVRG